MNNYNRVFGFVDYCVLIIKKVVKRAFYHRYGFHPQDNIKSSRAYIMTLDMTPITEVKNKKECRAVYVFADENKLTKLKDRSVIDS